MKSGFRGWVALTAAALLAGCAAYDGRGIKPGAKADEVRAAMGVPAETYRGADGEIWAYPRGPAGFQTYMVRLGADGVLRSVEPAFTEENFARVKAGMSTDEVRRLFGPPFKVDYFERRKETVWDYRYRDFFDYVAHFNVQFGPDGKVVGTVITREYPPDSPSQP